MEDVEDLAPGEELREEEKERITAYIKAHKLGKTEVKVIDGIRTIFISEE